MDVPHPDYESVTRHKNIRVRSGKAVLSVTIYPKENAETSILLHGGPGVPDEFIDVIEQLSPYFQVINFD